MAQYFIFHDTNNIKKAIVKKDEIKKKAKIVAEDLDYSNDESEYDEYNNNDQLL